MPFHALRTTARPQQFLRAREPAASGRNALSDARDVKFQVLRFQHLRFQYLKFQDLELQDIFKD